MRPDNRSEFSWRSYGQELGVTWLAVVNGSGLVCVTVRNIHRSHSNVSRRPTCCCSSNLVSVVTVSTIVDWLIHFVLYNASTVNVHTHYKHRCLPLSRRSTGSPAMGHRGTCPLHTIFNSEADLGMFSMFGWTAAPTKRGPTRGPANFCNIATCRK